MNDRSLYTGLIRLHLLHHAAEGPIYGQAMIDELGRRRIPVVRYSKEELAEELKHVRGLSGRR